MLTADTEVSLGNQVVDGPAPSVAEDDVTRKRIDGEGKEERWMRCWSITMLALLGHFTRKRACLSRLAAAFASLHHHYS